MPCNLESVSVTDNQFAGGFAKITKPTANLLPDDDPASSTYSGQRCVDWFLDHGATARKLNLGMPLYGTGWNGTEGMYSNWTSESILRSWLKATDDRRPRNRK
jgi:GH18 family chitinase